MISHNDLHLHEPSPLRSVSTPAEPPLAPPLMARAFSAPAQSGTVAEDLVLRTFDPLDRLAGGDGAAAATTAATAAPAEPHARAERSQSMLSVRSLRASALHTQWISSPRYGATSGAAALRALGLGAPGTTSTATTSSSSTGTPRPPPLLAKMASIFVRTPPSPALPETDGTEDSNADSAFIDLDAVFSDAAQGGSSDHGGGAAKPASSNLELLDLARAGKIALLVNDRTAWVTVLACITGFDAVALASVSHFWRERLARPSLMKPLWAYYIRNEFPEALPSHRNAFQIDFDSTQRKLWREVPNLFHFVTVAMRYEEPRRHGVEDRERGATTSSGRGREDPRTMQHTFIKEHIARIRRREEEIMAARKKKVMIRVRASRLCARRFVAHPVMCISSFGCLALPPLLLGLTVVLLTVQAAVVEGAPDGSATKAWGVGGSAALLWIWPTALIGLCWCTAFTCYAFHTILAFCQPRRSDGPNMT